MEMKNERVEYNLSCSENNFIHITYRACFDGPHNYAILPQINSYKYKGNETWKSMYISEYHY